MSKIDPLLRLRQKQQRELQHLIEYEKKLRDKEVRNSQLLLKKKEKFQDISMKQLKFKEDLKQKAEQKRIEFERNLSQAKLIEEEQLKVKYNQQLQQSQLHVNKTIDTVNKFEKEYQKEQLDFLSQKKQEHNHQIELVLQNKKKIENRKLKELSQSLDAKFKSSQELQDNLNKQLSDRQKQEQQKLQSYFKQVEEQQQNLQKERMKKGEMFEEKLDKVEKLKQEKEKELKERQRLRLEAEKQKELLSKEFQEEIVVNNQKQIQENVKVQFSQTVAKLKENFINIYILKKQYYKLLCKLEVQQFKKKTQEMTSTSTNKIYQIYQINLERYLKFFVMKLFHVSLKRVNLIVTRLNRIMYSCLQNFIQYSIDVLNFLVFFVQMYFNQSTFA